MPSYFNYIKSNVCNVILQEKILHLQQCASSTAAKTKKIDETKFMLLQRRSNLRVTISLLIYKGSDKLLSMQTVHCISCN